MAAADPSRAAPRGLDWWRDRAQSPAFVLGAIAAALGAAARAWIAHDTRPLSWNDSAEYLEAAQTPLFSLERLAGPRPILMPLLLSGTDQDLVAFVDWQVLVAALGWGVLAGAVAHHLTPLWAKCLGAGSILGLSLTWPVTMWDQQVLTESTAMTALALFAAALLGFWSHPRPRTSLALLGAATLWMVARDSHLVPVAAIGTAFVAVAWWLDRPRRRLVAVTGLYLVALAFLVASTSAHGHRGDRPLEHLYAVRVLPFPERVAWFSEHGMPDGPALASLPEAVDPVADVAPYTPIPPDARFERWRDWLARDGRATLVRYVLSHPSYLVAEPTAEPERVFNNLGGIEGYRPLELRTIPVLEPVFHPPTAAALVVAAGSVAVALALGRRRHLSPLFWVGLALVLSAAPHGAVVWHSDGMEASRHLLIPGIQLRLGTLLLVLVALAGDPRPRPRPGTRGTAPSPPVR